MQEAGPSGPIMAPDPTLERDIRLLFYTTLEKTTVDPRGMRHISMEVTEHFDVATEANLGDLFGERMEGLRNWLKDELLYARSF